jgi:tetratricopeptide (TPR) repeat protein
MHRLAVPPLLLFLVLAEAGALAAQEQDPLARAALLNKEANDLHRRGLPDEAIAKLEEAHRLAPREQVIARNLGLMLGYRARDARGRGALPEALQTLVRARGLAPDEDGLLVAWTETMAESLRADEALAELVNLLQAAPERPGVHTSLGRLALLDNRLDDAGRHLGRALELAPGDDPTLIWWGDAAIRRGESARAMSWVRARLVQEPERGVLHEVAAKLAYAEDRLEDAETHLAQAIEQDPGVAKRQATFVEKLRREAAVEKGYHLDQSGPFAVKFDDEAFRGTSREILALIDRHYARLGGIFGVWPQQLVTIVLYTREDYGKATAAHGWTGGLFDGKIRLPVRDWSSSRTAIESTLVHELTHLFVRALSRKVPVWLNEGLAQVHQGRTAAGVTAQLVKAREAALLPGISALPESWAGIEDRERVALYYAVALSFTAWLQDRFGAGSMAALLGSLDRSAAFGSAFEAEFGMPLEEAESEWRRSF